MIITKQPNLCDTIFNIKLISGYRYYIHEDESVAVGKSMYFIFYLDVLMIVILY